MAASRRRFLKATAAGAAATATAVVVTAQERPEARPAVQAPQRQIYLPQVHGSRATTGASAPVEVIATNRMAYGPRPGDLERVRQIGLETLIDEQLNPNDGDDPLLLPRLTAARLKIRYNAGEGYPARNQAAPLTLLDKGVKDLWSLTDYDNKMDWQERMRPFDEVRVATWLRAVYSKWQLRELLVEFWHNHFNVNASSDQTIVAGFPEYDRIIRRNCFGNFRVFVEQIAQSAAMMFYLDNRSNKAAGGEGGNENFARELFELQTLGSDNYRKFGNSDNIPKDPVTGVNLFYIDDDVYEAARCFTGWTIAHDNWELRQRGVPNTGEFYYFEDWHDTAQKFVLGKRLLRGQPALQDGRDVLEMIAKHPSTARFLCTKLCRRLIADSPPASVVDAAVAEWMANRDAPDQIKKVVRVILRSNEFRSTWGQKIKRPFEHIVAYLRATDAEMPVDAAEVGGDANKGGYWSSFFWSYGQAGHRIFEWPTPTGHPDVATYWSSTNGLLRRWNMPYTMVQSWSGNIKIDLAGQTNLNTSCIQIVDFWIGRLFGYSISPATRQAMIDFLAQTANSGDPNRPPRRVDGEWPNDNSVVIDRLNAIVQMLAMSPEYQLR
jgi:uncharacterized protein (DUF1800 family)